MELLKREISSTSSSPNSLHGVFSNLNPAARFLAQQEREASTRSKMSELEGFSASAKNNSNKTDDDNDGFDDALENNDNDLEPYFLHSNLGVILSEAHVPFLVQRSNEEEKNLVNENKNIASTNKNQSQKSSSSHEQQLEEESRNATRWIGRTSSSSSSSNSNYYQQQQPNFDKWLNRRLMRTFLPQVASVAEE